MCIVCSIIFYGQGGLEWFLVTRVCFLLCFSLFVLFWRGGKTDMLVSNPEQPMCETRELRHGGTQGSEDVYQLRWS